MIWSYIIPECNLSRLEELIEKINKQATKLNLKPITISNDGVDHRQLYVKKGDRKSTWVNEDSFDDDKHIKQGQVRNWLLITVDGEQPKFNGWTFCATLMPVPTDTGIENMIRKVPGVLHNVPTEYRDRAGECDHCKQNRRRNETYIVFSEEDGFKMVGSSCIKDFLGHTDPHAIAKYLELLNTFDVSCSNIDEDGYFKSENSSYLAKSVLAQTSAVIRVFGWTSKKQVWNQKYGTATATRVGTYLLPPHILSSEEKKEQKESAVTDEDIERGEKIFEYLESIDRETENEYMYNLSLLGRSSCIGSKSLGILCSAVVAYDRELAKKASFKDYSSSEYVGDIKERREMNITVDRIFEKEGDFGLTKIHHMIDELGNYLVWFCSGVGLQVGDTYKVKATVKKHSEYNGVKQTIVNRVTPILEKVQK